MAIKDQLTHAADVAKWKVDQQARILKAQNEISTIKSEIRKMKAALGVRTYEIFKDGGLKAKSLLETCTDIKKKIDTGEALTAEIETIRNEEPPELKISPSKPKRTMVSASGLICPECSIEIPVGGKYCPTHGIEGILPQVEEEPIKETSGLVCPNCGISVPIKFCVECGAEGVEAGKA